MIVLEVMSRQIRTCSMHDTLNTAAQLMWTYDCGCIPVVDEQLRVVSMITDRDICMAAYTQGKPLSEMPVASAASHGAVTIRETETVAAAETLMRKHQVRRLPVVDASGRALGVLTLCDLVRHIQPERSESAPSADSLTRTLSAICQPHAGRAFATAAE